MGYIDADPKLTITAAAAAESLTTLATGAVPVKSALGTLVDSVYTNVGATLANATAAGTGWTLAGAFAPTSGSDVYALHAISLTVNQTGGANGAVTAVRVNLTETAAVGQTILADYQVGGISRWRILGTSPITSAADAAWDAFKAAAFTQNFKGNTRINSLISKIAFYAPTLASDTATLTIDKCATLYIDGPPVAGTNIALTSAAALVVGSGNVGIGTATPLGKATIYGTAASAFTGVENGLVRLNADTGANTYSCIDFATAAALAGSTKPLARIAARITASGSYLYFGTSNIYSSGINQTSMVLDYNGSVGIGTVPGASSRLHVVSTQSIASGATAMLRAVYFATETITITGTTNIDTATGFNKLVLEAPTYSNASIVIAKAFTQRIDNAPQVTGGATITARGALLVSAGSIVCQGAALATDATEGFLYIPTCAGTPTGVPQVHAGTVPIVYDTTNHKLYVYDSGWKGGTAPGAWS